MARYDSGWRYQYGRDFQRWPGYSGRTNRGGGGYPKGPYDREIYGGAYPGFREYPGPRGRGASYRGYDQPFYDRAAADRPFLPEEAYRRHPDFDRPQRHLSGRWPDAPSGRGFRPAHEDDGEVRQSVRQSLYSDSWVDADRIEVEVEDGVVTLTGSVNDYMEARYAWDDAWETPGVRGVVNQLTVTLGEKE